MSKAAKSVGLSAVTKGGHDFVIGKAYTPVLAPVCIAIM